MRYLRDLLVFKVETGRADGRRLSPSCNRRWQAQAALIETDRLLELIEQFAEAEGRMKWAPNKKLHFEVAVIKAIQTLSQVTLTEVIDNLAALRGGTSITSVQSIPKTVAPAEKAIREGRVPAPKTEKPVPRAPRLSPLPADRRTKMPPAFRPPRPPQAARST